MAMAKKAASMYMKQDLERKRSMQMLDDAIEMLGPIEKAKPNPLLVNYVEAMKRAIESAKNNYNVNDDGPCTDYAEKALLHISGSPSFADVNGKPNPLLLSTDPDKNTCTAKKNCECECNKMEKVQMGACSGPLILKAG